ncbi:MAG: flavodoxin family protein [Paludibacter sp.]|nr:flavodoxin family protein [Paludibacter sp.]
MKVIAINGSPHKDGNTALALQTVGEKLKSNGIDFEVLHIGHKTIHGCIACGQCREKQDHSCGIKNDAFNEFIPAIREADGIILGSPVYFSGMAGTMKSFLDRLFYVSGSNGNYFRNKVGAALVCARRAGGSHTLDGLNHYLNFAEMLVATSNYWNIIHGGASGEVLFDKEGITSLQVLGDKMSWMLKMREATKNTLPEPERVQKPMTNFIREDLK